MSDSELHAAVGLRNRLVHEYGTIDRPRIEHFLHTHLQDFRDFNAALLRHVGLA